MKILSINSPYISHKNPTTAPEEIIGKGNIDASLFFTISFYKFNYYKLRENILLLLNNSNSYGINIIDTR